MTSLMIWNFRTDVNANVQKQSADSLQKKCCDAAKNLKTRKTVPVDIMGFFEQFFFIIAICSARTRMSGVISVLIENGVPIDQQASAN